MVRKLRSYSQRLRFVLSAASGMAPGASAVIVDWLGAGRVAQGERWAFKDYRSRVEVVREATGDCRGKGDKRYETWYLFS